MRQFIRGERAKLSELAAINHLWEVEVGIEAPFFIVDFGCLGLGADGEIVDDRFLVNYNQPDAPGNAIRLDNTSNNSAIFSINLGQLPPVVRRLVFTATLNRPEMPGGLLGAAFSVLGGFPTNIGEGTLLLRTPAVETGFFAFSGEDFGGETTLILGELYLRDEWRFVAAGQPLKGELGVFLRSLTDGPLPSSRPNLAPSLRPVSSVTAQVAAPPRPPRPAVVPSSLPAPQTPVPPKVVTPRPALTPQTTSLPLTPHSEPQPVVQSIAPPEKLPIAAPPTPIPPVFPQSLPTGGKLQDLIDEAAPGSTLTLMTDEYEGPITIKKSLSLEGRESALWARIGPVVTVSAPNVSLHDLDIEITVSPDAPDATGVALQVENGAPRIELDNVRMRGRINGLGPEDGDWRLPLLLDLGQFAPRAANDFQFSLRVPASVRLSSAVEGITVFPGELAAGEHQIALQVRDVAPETLIVGFIEVRSASLLRTIPLSGQAAVGAAPKVDFPLD